jgi:alginate O-acetyltransferase complex protein AlgI
MAFNTIEYGIFYFIFFVIYWFLLRGKTRSQNSLILVASYIFYGWWDWRFLILIVISSGVDFAVGLQLSNTEKKFRRRLLLYISIFVNLGLLFSFKYFNFFLDSFKTLFKISEESGFNSLDIILPVGISFYTLQTLSYTIDVYDKKLKASTDIVAFFSYVAFFPQLVAGPIEKARDLLPQFSKKREFSYGRAADGLRQVLWGLFKKMVVADNIGHFMNAIMFMPEAQNGSSILVFVIVASIRFYCDFSGYSDIAIGSARIIGFDLTKNFSYPLFARNMSEFWQKWHITLISWIRTYLVNRLKGRTKVKITRNIFIVFILTGLWHGANWTYIIWGVVHALFFLPLIYGKRIKHRYSVAKGRVLPDLKELYLMLKVFLIFALVGVLFISRNIFEAVDMYKSLLSPSLFHMPKLPSWIAIISIVFLLLVEWIQREKKYGLELDKNELSWPIRWSVYFTLVFTILIFGAENPSFIYFQF